MLLPLYTTFKIHQQLYTIQFCN